MLYMLYVITCFDFQGRKCIKGFFADDYDDAIRYYSQFCLQNQDCHDLRLWKNDGAQKSELVAE